MKLITWNVQWGRGVDQLVDVRRIVEQARAIADFDVLCLQEVADHYGTPRLAGHDGSDQFAAFTRLLDGFVGVPGIAVDVAADDGRRRRFGNMILSRLPVRQVFSHLLPFPVDPGVKGMPRIVVEAVVRASFGEVRVMTTHLEYYGTRRRTAQVEGLRQAYIEGAGHAAWGDITDSSGGPFHTLLRPRATVVTGDFNFEPEDPLHARMLAPFDDGSPPLRDAWTVRSPGVAHPATFKIHEKEHPDEPELHCDFIFVSEDLAPRVREVRVDQATQASDHQPVLLHLA